ncbi:MAG: S8 family serine peptidase, partial [Verrucomicrobiota bacterium]|nr:S8 family serine peptidase [Verrucomicrobiota bacterium]
MTGPAGEPNAQGDLPASLQGPVTVMIELDSPPAVVTYANALKAAQSEAAALGLNGRPPLAAAQNGASKNVQISSAAASQVRNEVLTLDAAQQALLPSINNVNGQVLFRTQRVYNGIAVLVDGRHISELASMPGVKAIHPMMPQYPTAFSDIDFLGSRVFWTKVFSQGVGLHGEGIKIGDIDTGLDYIHTDFGGPGTNAAYSSVSDTSAVPNAFFPTAKIPGGFDFAGDGYNASGTAAQRIPKPDPNPLDSNGHGTATASLIAGYGVNPGGSTYVGNYDNSTPTATMKIAPGQAPQALIYPLRVFGTAGSTNLTSAAIEWSIDPNGDGDFSDHLDVINMSLGANFGYPDDASAVSAANAATAGIIVCSASGNAGDSYYITSAPGIAPGTLSIAASFNDQNGFISNAQVCNGTSGCVQPASGSLSGQKGFAIYTSPSPRTSISGNIVQAVPPDTQNSKPLTNAAQISGNIALVNRVPGVGFQQAQNVRDAGAIGIIFIQDPTQNNGDPLTLDVSSANPPIAIPSAMISSGDGNYIKSAAVFDPVTGVPVTQTRLAIQVDNVTVVRPNAPADTIPSYSSRGPGYSNSF